MAFDVADLVPFLRVMADDNDVDLREYTDLQLEDEYLRTGIMAQEASWNQGYTVGGTTGSYTISPDPPQWLQILYVVKTALMMKIFQEKFSYNNKVMSVTRTSKTEDLKGLQFLYEEIVSERKNQTVGYAFTCWDDLFTRPYLIDAELEEGYR